MWNFEGKVVAVTGASRGIGFEIARQFALAGAQVGICSPHMDRVEKAAREIGGDIFTYQADVSDIQQNDAFIQAVIEKFGKIDILICNAGVEVRKPCMEITPDEWDWMFQVNTRSFFFGAMTAARDMIKRNIPGIIIGVSSVNAQTVVPGLSVYAATKCAMNHLAESMSRELGKQGIRVNCIAPGSILTDINRHIYCIPENLKALQDKLPLERQGTCEEIADSVLFLASDAAKYITGQTLYVDGGLTLVRG